MDELVKHIEKFKGLMIELKKYYIREIKKHADLYLKLKDRLEKGCQYAGEIRGDIKAIVKQIDKHGDIDDEVLEKLHGHKAKLEAYEKEFGEVELRNQMDDEARMVERLESELAVISKVD